ncbi:UNVERIFIED_ORG: hypothetical protein B2H93_14810 [Clostridium botulinum]
MLNREDYKKYQREYYKNHKEYFKEYYENHKERILQFNKEWREKYKGDYVYFHMDNLDEILYIGSTSRVMIERQSLHMNGKSNLKMNEEEYKKKYGFKNILYKDFTKYNLNREDLYYIESYFKDIYEEKIKGKSVRYKIEKLSKKKEELIQIAQLEEFQEFNKLNRYKKS